jgi:hypothetical protein
MQISTTIRRKALALIISCFLFCQLSSAQFVTIPDSNFISWLNNSNYASCMTGNQMDTTCTALVTDTFFDIHFTWIHDLTGVQYLKNLKHMYCNESQLTYIPALPPRLTALDCFSNHLTALPPLPATLTRLSCPHNQLTAFPALPAGLTYLDCSSNQIAVSVPTLPIALTYFDCHSNLIPGILPNLGSNMIYLNISINRFTIIRNLPAGLQTVLCYYDSLSSLPGLPTSLVDLQCDFNQITSLPNIHNGLQNLSCGNNLLTTTPTLPNSITSLNLANNRLTSITNLPDSMDLFYCSYNPDLTCLPRLGKIGSFNFNNTAITCLGNYPIPDSNTISNSNPPFNTVPLCVAGNANGCVVYTGVSDINATSILSIYPNPATDILHVSYQTAGNLPAQISICDVQGRRIRAMSTVSQDTDINTSFLSPGVYFIHLAHDGAVINRSFIKQ